MSRCSFRRPHQSIVVEVVTSTSVPLALAPTTRVLMIKRAE